MPTELVEIAPRGITRAMSQDSEYDDALEVPDSLEMVDENGETIQIHKEGPECIDSRGTNLYSA